MQDRIFGRGKVVIPLLTLGYPDLETSEQLVYVLEEAGVDLIMLGIPFSDPAGESPVLRRAGEIALENGLTTDQIFDFLAGVRKKSNVPLALRSYANIVFAYGTERFVQNAARQNVDALVLLDVPYEEQAEFKGACDKYGIRLISIVAQAPADRIAHVVGQAQDFIYLAGSVTEELIATVRQFTDLPIVASNINVVSQANPDGIVLESEIMELVVEYGRNARNVILDYAKNMVATARSYSHLKKRSAAPRQTSIMATRMASSRP